MACCAAKIREQIIDSAATIIPRDGAVNFTLMRATLEGGWTRKTDLKRHGAQMFAARCRRANPERLRPAKESSGDSQAGAGA